MEALIIGTYMNTQKTQWRKQSFVQTEHQGMNGYMNMTRLEEQ